jgi:t-SNARE complex subunit (syntaxin)
MKGQLFNKVANLVVEQGETLSRIEDDIEGGLADTKDGHQVIHSLTLTH